MIKRMVEFIRRKNRARLERRRLAKASGEPPAGWLARTVASLRAKNRVRLARRRANRQLLASLAANDTALLEASIFLLKAIRQEQRARADGEEALARRLGGLEDRIDGGVRLLAARMTALEARLSTAGRPDEGSPQVAAAPARPAGVNGDLRRGHAQASAVAEHEENAEKAVGGPEGRPA